MQKKYQAPIVRGALALSILGWVASSAHAAINVYGNIDAAVDHVHKGQGSIADNTYLSSVVPTLAAAAAAAQGGNYASTYQLVAGKLRAAYANHSSLTRITPSIASQNALGIQGSEDLGGGYKTAIVLEGQFNTDSGAQGGQDSRMWGRQAYIGLTTPVGEVRVGRQYAPMFYTYAM